MATERFEFGIEKRADGAVIAMNCGGGVIRIRHMPLKFLAHLGSLCRKMRRKATKLAPKPSEVPVFPGYIRLLEANSGVCRITLGVHRDEGGTVEHVIAFYDEGIDTSPALVLVEEQIEEFIEQATGKPHTKN